ncbi:MAG TPA: LytTR family DNA-binding domain-containing protein [Vicinamibacterales bacterium]|nr:LytTR family DNA-binding domain-containing protein [Vicinamibacterales bacterium]
MPDAILVADDEPLARRTLTAYLRELGCAGTIHEAADGDTAIAVARRERPALIFLDIVMPGTSGLQVLEQLDYDVRVVFTTAHDQHAVTAFELGALDYVLKPFGRERLERALERCRIGHLGPAADLAARARETLQPSRQLSKLFVRDGARIVPIALASIERAQGADDYVTLHAGGKEHLVSIRLSDLEAHLAQAQFLRVHRSHLVNLEFVVAIEPYDAARMQVVMKNGARIVASRAGTRRLRELAL